MNLEQDMRRIDHAELVMMFPERFCEEVTRFMEE